MRLRQQDDEQRAATAAKAFSRHEVNERRAEVVEAVASLIESARTRVLDVRISPEVAAIVRESAQLAGYGRASVPRDSRGDISDVAEWEEPARLTHQLKKLASGLLALEVGEDATRRIVRRAAISVIPPMRAIVLHHLATLGENERRSTNHVMREVGRSYKPVKRALEDWAETRVVEMAISDERGQLTQEYEENTPTRDTRARMWRIHPDRRSLVQRGIG